MPSSGYTAITFVANEQPTTAKWNLIGSNDSSFNLGTGFEDAILLTRHVPATTAFQVGATNITPTANKLAYAQATANFTTTTNALATGLSAAVASMPAGGRSIKITAFSLALSNSASPTNSDMSIEENGVEVGRCRVTSGGANYCSPGTAFAIRTPAPGAAVTYTVRLYNVGGATAQMQATATSPMFVLVEAI